MPPPDSAASPVAPPASPALHRPVSKADLFWSCSVMALQGFGGVIAVVQRELVDRKQWMTRQEFIEDWSVAQIMPGPNVINLSILMGNRYFGWRGSCAAVAGILTFPLLVLLLALLFSGVSDVPAAQGAMRGMGAVVAGLIAATGLRMIEGLRKNALGAMVCAALAVTAFILIALLRLPLAWALLGLGSLACLWAWRQIGRLEARGRPEAPR
jgi:chromate transporter